MFDIGENKVKESESPNPYEFPSESEWRIAHPEAKKSYEQAKKANDKRVNMEMAERIWVKGDMGKGRELIDNLRVAGYDPVCVQVAINEYISNLENSKQISNAHISTKSKAYQSMLSAKSN